MSETVWNEAIEAAARRVEASHGPRAAAGVRELLKPAPAGAGDNQLMGAARGALRPMVVPENLKAGIPIIGTVGDPAKHRTPRT